MPLIPDDFNRRQLDVNNELGMRFPRIAASDRRSDRDKTIMLPNDDGRDGVTLGPSVRRSGGLSGVT